MKEAAARKILAQPGRFFRCKVQSPGFHDIQIRITEEVRLHDVDNIRMRIYRQAGQAMNASHELAIAPRIVRGPTPTLDWEKIASAKLWTAEWSRFCHGAAHPQKTTASSRPVFSI